MGNGVLRSDFANRREDTIMALAKSVHKIPTDPENLKDINELWIDIKVRTPNEAECKRMNGYFLTCRSDNTINIDRFLSYGAAYSPKSFFVKDSTDVIAWMNLPDPYMPYEPEQ